MSGATSDAGRFWQGTPGAPAIKDAWGTFLNDNAGIIAQIVTGYVAVNIAGLGTYTLTTANWTSDQARPFMIDFTGALTGNCTATIPNVQRYGWARNSTTGSHNVLLTSGGGTQATLPPDGKWRGYWCDGSGNVSLPAQALGSLTVDGALAVSGATTLTGSLTANGGGSVTGALTVSTAGTSGNQAVNFSQFSQDISTSGYITFPGGLVLQWGKALRNGTGTIHVSLSHPFGSAILSITATPISGTAAEPLSVTNIALSSFDINVSHSNIDVYWMVVGS